MADYSYGDYATTTSYGAQGGSGGGGFMAGGSQSATIDRSAKDTLRPVTIKQIIDAELPHPDADFRIDNEACSNVTFVGQIRNISQQATNYTYKIDDGTGTIEVKRWIDPDEQNAMEEDGEGKMPRKLANDMYVRIFGSLKNFNNKRHVGARPAGIRPVIDHNEVNCHLLEATLVHLEASRGPPPQPGQQNATNGVAYGGQANGASALSSLPTGTTAKAKRVYNCIREHPHGASGEGVHVQDLSVSLNMQIADVKAACEELSSHSVVFTTTDDDTYAILDGIGG